MSSQSNSRTGSGFDKRRDCTSAKHMVVSKPVASTNDEASRGCTSNSESMATSDCRVCLEPQAARLEKNITNLSIDESTGYQAPMDKLTATGSHGLNAEYLRPLDVDLAISKPTLQSTRGWKRLAYKVGNIDQRTKGCSGPNSKEEKNDFGKRGMCMDIDVQIEGKKQCIGCGSQGDDQISKVVAGFQHHQSQ